MTTKYGFLIAGFFFLKAAFGAASKQSGHQEHREEYCFFPYTLQLGKEPQPIHPANKHNILKVGTHLVFN